MIPEFLTLMGNRLIYRQAKSVPLFHFGVIILILLFSPAAIYCAFEHDFSGARQNAMGGSFVSAADDAFAIFHNPAGLFQLSHSSLSLSYCRPFGMKELNQYTGVFAFPLWGRDFAGAWKQTGFSLYNEQWILLASGFRLQKRLALGVTFKYFGLTIERYGNRHELNSDIGFLYLFHENWSFGGSIRNVFNSTIGRLPLVQRDGLIGIAYRFFSKGLIMFDGRIDNNSAFDHSVGIEIDLQKSILFRFGFQDRSEQVAGGLGLIVKGHSIDYGLTYNSMLGYTHSFSLSFILFR